VQPGQPALVSFSVDLDVLLVLLAELLTSSVDGLDASLLAHSLGGEVGVASCSVPVSGDGLGVDRDHHPKVLSDLVEDEAGHPEVITDLNSAARADLELPLAGHDLSVGAADLDSGVEAGLVVGLNDVPSKDAVSAHSAVVGSLGGRVSSLGPAIGMAVGLEEGVLLLDSEPGFVVLALLKDLGGMVARVGGMGGSVVLQAFAHHQDVVSATEGVAEDGGGLDKDIGVVSGGLAGGGAVKVPDLELRDALGDSVKGHGLLAEVLLAAINPDVGGQDLSLLVKLAVVVEDLLVRHLLLRR